MDLSVKGRIVVSTQSAPVRDSLVPLCTTRSVRTILEVGEGGLIRSNHADASSPLNRHIADRHATLHRHLLDGLAAILDHMTLSPTGADLGDEGQDEVLRCDLLRHFPIHHDGHRCGTNLREGLGSQHMLNLAGTDTEG